MAVLLGSVAFFLSGLAALVYQIVWQRLLVLPMGADVYSTTIIVAAFMAGLGCGSLAGGHIADRLPRRQCLLLFIGAELAIGAFGLVSRYIFHDWMYFTLGATSMPAAAMGGVVFLGLLWPTFWMGVSLPLLGRAVTRSIAGAPAQVGLLYGLNTLGAATGAFATAWLLFPSMGLAGSLRFAAILNGLAALAALVLAVADRSVTADEAPAAPPARGESRRPPRSRACGPSASGPPSTPSRGFRPSRSRSSGSGCSASWSSRRPSPSGRC